MYYTVKSSPKNGVSFLIDRFFRIYPVYWFMTLLLLISATLLPFGSYDTFYTPLSLVKSFLLITSKNPNGGVYPYLYVGWSLIYEMFFYLILSVALFFDKKRALLYTAVILVVFPLIVKSEILGYSNFLIYEFLAGLGIGYLYFRTKNLLSTNIYLFVSLFSVLLCFADMCFVQSSFFQRITGASLLVVSFLYLDQQLFSKPHKNIFVKMGDASYSTYLVHPIILGWLVLLFKHSDTPVIRLFIIIGVVILVGIISYWSYNFIERNRSLSVLKNTIKSALKV